MTTLLEAPRLPLTYVPPLYRHVPDSKVGDFGPEITDMMGLFGVELDPVQVAAAADLSGFDSRGKWVSLESGVVEARQNGKTAGCVLPVTLFDLFHLPPDRICWTAHRFKTARDTFENLFGSDEAPGLIDRAPEYGRKIRRINRSHGEEAVMLKSGATLDFLARENAGSGRGIGGKRVVLDEALILKGGLIGGLLPTLSARSGKAQGAHVNYASSAAFATPESDYLHSLVRRGRYAAPGDRFIWLEWCAPGGWGTNPCDLKDECPHDGRLGCRYPLCTLGSDCPHTLDSPGCCLDNLELIQRANHALGGRITVQYVKDERQAMARLPREYGRERLGWHEEAPVMETPNGVDLTLFGGLANDRLMPPTDYDQAAIVVDMPPDRSEVNIAVAWNATDPKDNETYPAVMVHTLPGTKWKGDNDEWTTAVAFVAGTDDEDWGLTGKVDLVELAIQAGGPANSLIAPLNARGRDAYPEWKVKALTVQEYSAAVGHWRDGVKDRAFRHLGQKSLLDAQSVATLKKSGDALIWERDDLSNISPLIAATLALHRLFTEGDEGGPNIY